MLDFLFWIASIAGAIVAWELFGMGLDWWGLVPLNEWTKWGREDTKSDFYHWSIRLGPLQIFRMR